MVLAESMSRFVPAPAQAGVQLAVFVKAVDMTQRDVFGFWCCCSRFQPVEIALLGGVVLILPSDDPGVVVDRAALDQG